MQPFYCKPVRNREERFQRVLHHLQEYGNTIAAQDIEYIEARLKEEGVACVIRKRTVKSEGRGKKEVYWYIECSTGSSK